MLVFGQMEKESQISLEPGLKIGYREVLGRVTEEISLGAGNHYLLARNGRGKTTLLRTLASSLKPLAGGFRSKGGMKFIPEDIYFNGHLTSKAIFKALIPRSRYKAALEMAAQIELEVKKVYRALSTGNQRKVSLLVAEFSSERKEGEVLLLDEPFTGLDSYVREVFLKYWEENQDGICRLVSCHPDFDSMNLSSVVIISDGNIYQKLSAGEQTWKDLRTELA